MRLRHLIYCALLMVGLYILRGCGMIWNPFSRYDQLKSVVNRHVGYGHVTRGMNRYTVEALASAVTKADLPLLAQMLDDKDVVTAMTATNVLAGMGEEGQELLQTRLKELSKDGPSLRDHDSIHDRRCSTRFGKAKNVSDKSKLKTRGTERQRQGRLHLKHHGIMS